MVGISKNPYGQVLIPGGLETFANDRDSWLRGTVCGVVIAVEREHRATNPRPPGVMNFGTSWISPRSSRSSIAVVANHYSEDQRHLLRASIAAFSL